MAENYLQSVANETATVAETVSLGGIRAIMVGAVPVIWLALLAGITVMLVSLPARLMRLE